MNYPRLTWTYFKVKLDVCAVFMHGKETQNPLLVPLSKEDEGFVGKVKMSS